MEFRSVESTHCIVVDDATGLPTAIISSALSGERLVRIEAVVECEVDGSECRSPTGGIEYVDTLRLPDCVRTAAPTMHETLNGRTWRVPVRIGRAVGKGGVTGHLGEVVEVRVIGELIYSLNRLGPLVSPPRVIDAPAGLQDPASIRMPHSSIGTPLGSPIDPAPAIDSQASVIRQPRSGARLP